jgi:hypothetical protein
MSAIISPCGRYRYRLERGLKVGPSVAFIMVNPSTADAEQDDATIRKCRGFATAHGYGHFIVGNLFAYRATDIKVLRVVDEPMGIANDGHLKAIMHEADTVIVAWGPMAKLPRRLRKRWIDIVRIAGSLDKPLYCLGTAKDGHPRHPLMTPYSTPLTLWEIQR